MTPRKRSPEDDGAARRVRARLMAIPPRPVMGTITRVSGPVIETSIDGLRIGELCRLADPGSRIEGSAEVIGLGHRTAILVPIGGTAGLSTRTTVIPTGAAMRVRVSPDLVGRVLDGFGQPLDGRPAPEHGTWRPVEGLPPDAMKRDVIRDPLPTGVRVIDSLLTCGIGQRIGIFGEPGGGKSSLMSCLVKGAAVDVSVIALIGERGREVREFIERDLGAAGLARAVVVIATSDRPALERFKAAQVATAIAEEFRDSGKNVLLLMDSVTRLARAQREIGLAAGEPPTRRGYPPSVFAMMPSLLERAGPGIKGSITGFFTVLLEGDDTQDPVAEEVKSILDGHILLSAKLARAEHYPAIDVLRSRSRVMSHVVAQPHREAAAKLRQLIARYDEIELLLKVGEYRPGSDPLADEAVRKIDSINAFLKQGMNEQTGWGDVLRQLRGLAA